MTSPRIHPAWSVLGLLLAIPGGIPGTLFGIYMAFGNYTQPEKIKGIVILTVSLIMTYFWFFSAEINPEGTIPNIFK